MSENNRCSCNAGGASGGGRETVCIDTYRVLDSCRDRDCYENARVYLGRRGQELVNRNGATVQVVCAKILWTYISVDPIQFNRGFYQVTARFYILVRMEACIGGGRSQEFCGIAVLDKKVVLYGGEGNVHIFRSDPEANRCTPWRGSNHSTNTPIGVIEAVEPVVLGSLVVEPDNCDCPCYCCCSCDEIPEDVREQSGIDDLSDSDEDSRLYVSLGLFSVFRIERPAQYLITASDYSVPDKECVSSEPNNPCSLFRNMAFPTGEFNSGASGRDKDNHR
ncbi:MAG: hypothetical protein IJ009_07870 [Clostridia bacterium]|nr:hypothetical protein [Clostridia bacterium]